MTFSEYDFAAITKYFSSHLEVAGENRALYTVPSSLALNKSVSHVTLHKFVSSLQEKLW